MSQKVFHHLLAFLFCPIRAAAMAGVILSVLCIRPSRQTIGWRGPDINSLEINGLMLFGAKKTGIWAPASICCFLILFDPPILDPTALVRAQTAMGLTGFQGGGTLLKIASGLPQRRAAFAFSLKAEKAHGQPIPEHGGA